MLITQTFLQYGQRPLVESLSLDEHALCEEQYSGLV